MFLRRGVPIILVILILVVLSFHVTAGPFNVTGTAHPYNGSVNRAPIVLAGPPLIIETFPDRIGCGQQGPPAGQAHNATFDRHYRNFSQFDDGVHGLENQSCAPTSGATIIDYLNRTLHPGLTRNMTKAELVANLTAYMNTSTTGTNNDDTLFGIMRFLQNRSIMGNFTFKLYAENYTMRGRNRAYPVGYNFTFTNRTHYLTPGNFTWINGNANLTNIFREMPTELIIVGYVIVTPQNDTFDHAMALDDLNQQPNPDNTYNISFMDPATGGTVYGTIDQQGNIHLADGTTGTPKGMEVISPR